MRQFWLLFVALVLMSASVGCASIPKGNSAVDLVEVEGNDEVSSSDIEEKMATTETPKFLGLFRGVVFDYSLFDAGVLQRDLARVERYYRARGFYAAHARAGRVVHVAENHVEVTIFVEEGPRTRIGKLDIEGVQALPAGERDALAAASSGVGLGEPFEEESFEDARKRLRRALTTMGYAWAKVEKKADVDLLRHEASVRFIAVPGPRATFGEVRVTGLKELPKDVVIDTANIDVGDPYSTETLADAQQAVLGLGTFSSVELVPTLNEPPPADRRVPVVIKVKEQKLRSVLLGGGTELDSIRFQLHLRAGWEDQNFLGGFRDFKVELKPGIDLYPTRLPTFQAPTAVLPEERFQASLRQPAFLERRTVGVTTHQLNAYPLLLSPEVHPEDPVLGYLEYKGAVGIERTFWKLFVSPTYNFQFNLPFTYIGPQDDDLRGLLISYLGAVARLDLRDDRIKPHEGIYIENDLQFAGLGGDARDFREQPEVRGYIPLGKKVTIALRATVGFLFPLNYGDAAKAARNQESGVDRARWVEDIETIYLRGFFSGGPGSNRGYPLRGVGPHGRVPFFSPGLAAAEVASSCDPDNAKFDAIRCGVPLGGLSLWEASLELRFPIVEPLGGAIFCDLGDVAAQMLTLRLDYPHLSCGLGVRYDTPIGPIRLDIGVRIPGAQYPSDANLIEEGDPGTIFGAPLALALGLGEAF